MRKKISLGVAAALALLCCLVTFEVTYHVLFNKFEKKFGVDVVSQSKNEASENDSDFLEKAKEKLAEVDSVYRNNYIGELDDDMLLDYIAMGYVAGTGDDYGAYYSADDLDDFVDDLNGEMVGIGVNVIFNTEFRAIEIINVFPDSPALEAGVEPGDIIVTVGEDKESVSELGYYPAINKIKGEEGTTAVFSVLRGEDHNESVNFSVERRRIVNQSVTYHVYSQDNKVGVIRISEFDTQTPVQFVNAVETLTADGCEKIVIDLRYNPGGELSSIVTTLDFILPEGPIIRIFDADGKEVDAYYSESGELDVPMAVLVNENTASAAELFTAAVRDYDKALIVGTTTYGKGCMQSTIPLSDGSAVTVTNHMYNPPFSDNYHGVGIVPDVEIELDESLEDKNFYKITDEEDNQLTAAVEALNK